MKWCLNAFFVVFFLSGKWKIPSEVFCRNCAGGSVLLEEKEGRDPWNGNISAVLYTQGSASHGQEGCCFLLCGYTCLFHYNLVWLKPQGLGELCVLCICIWEPFIS